MDTRKKTEEIEKHTMKLAQVVGSLLQLRDELIDNTHGEKRSINVGERAIRVVTNAIRDIKESGEGLGIFCKN